MNITISRRRSIQQHLPFLNAPICFHYENWNDSVIIAGIHSPLGGDPSK
jgi:hypothetical protein